MSPWKRMIIHSRMFHAFIGTGQVIRPWGLQTFGNNNIEELITCSSRFWRLTARLNRPFLLLYSSRITQYELLRVFPVSMMQLENFPALGHGVCRHTQNSALQQFRWRKVWVLTGWFASSATTANILSHSYLQIERHDDLVFLI